MDIDISKGWLPDFPPFDERVKGGLVRFENYIPTSEMALPFRNPINYSETSGNAHTIGDVPHGDALLGDTLITLADIVDGIPMNAIEFLDNTEIYRLFIGTATKLYRMNPDRSLTNVSKSATSYTNALQNWSFASYEQNIIATNYTDAPQVLAGMSAANFADLGGSPPKAKFCLINNGHLIFAYLNEGGTITQNKLLWSAREDFDDFVTDLVTQSGSQVLYASPTPITGMMNITRDRFLVFHEKSITLGNYIGNDYGFGFEENRFKNVGAIQGTPVVKDGICYFWDENDICITDGNSLTRIGFGFKNTVLRSLKKSANFRITATHDPFYPVIYWNIVTINSADSTPDLTIAYNYESKKVSTIPQNVHCMFTFHADAPDPDRMTNIYADSIPAYGDSREWLDSTKKLGCITKDGHIATFDGDAMTGVIETGEYTDNSIIMVTRVRPNVLNAITAPSVRIGSRMTTNDSVTYSSASSVASNGYANVRSSGRFNRIELTTANHSGIPNTFTAEAIKIGDK